jgi:hypothetical protein
MFILPLVMLSMVFYTKFLNWNERQKGVLIHDRLLEILPSKDCSSMISLLEVVCGIYIFYKIGSNWQMYELFWFKYAFICYVKIVTLFFIPLEPPKNIIPMKDAVLDNIVFVSQRKAFIKDLFFSGHTSFIVLCLLTCYNIWLVISCFLMAFMLLLSKNHYTIDVIVAPFIVFTVNCIVNEYELNILNIDNFLINKCLW